VFQNVLVFEEGFKACTSRGCCAVAGTAPGAGEMKLTDDQGRVPRFGHVRKFGKGPRGGKEVVV
jgi:hypothetical protein